MSYFSPTYLSGKNMMEDIELLSRNNSKIMTKNQYALAETGQKRFILNKLTSLGVGGTFGALSVLPLGLAQMVQNKATALYGTSQEVCHLFARRFENNLNFIPEQSISGSTVWHFLENQFSKIVNTTEEYMRINDLTQRCLSNPNEHRLLEVGPELIEAIYNNSTVILAAAAIITVASVTITQLRQTQSQDDAQKKLKDSLFKHYTEMKETLIEEHTEACLNYEYERMKEIESIARNLKAHLGSIEERLINSTPLKDKKIEKLVDILEEGVDTVLLHGAIGDIGNT